jgi:hypothetical protein
MLKWHEAHITAEVFKHMALLHTLTVFTESDEIDRVLIRQFTEQVEGALIGAAIERVRDVGIDDEDVHELR